jgi:hypothetical protein
MKMKSRKGYVRFVGLVASLAGVLVLAVPALAAPLVMQTTASASNAAAGESGATVAASAIITVLVTDPASGAAVSGLGATVGNGTSAVALPAGWSFINGVVPPGGYGMSITQFVNAGNGTYHIRVVPSLLNPSSVWFEGDYHYVVGFSSAKLSGGALGSLAIPAP